MNCQTVEEKLVLHLYEELAAEERAAVDAHLSGCPRCAAAADELRRLRTVLDHRPRREPSPDLLVRCRWDLEEALDLESRSWRGLVRSWWGLSPGRPAWQMTTALAILLLGFSLGWTLQGRTPVAAPGGNEPSAAWIGADLGNVRISGISHVAPDRQTGDVRVTLNAERRVTLEGPLDDPRIQKVLVYAVKSYDNPGIRHDTLELLQGRSDNPYVREALLYALRHDPNAGVRLGALEAARRMAWSPTVRQALLETLERDTNPGVRVAAVSLLIERGDKELLPVFEQLATHDPNPYVRLKCAKAVRERARAEF